MLLVDEPQRCSPTGRERQNADVQSHMEGRRRWCAGRRSPARRRGTKTIAERVAAGIACPALPHVSQFSYRRARSGRCSARAGKQRRWRWRRPRSVLTPVPLRLGASPRKAYHVLPLPRRLPATWTMLHEASKRCLINNDDSTRYASWLMFQMNRLKVFITLRFTREKELS